MTNIAVTGSIAYDYIMDYNDLFQNHILPEKIHILNVAFNIDNLKKNYGWTGGNISYNIALLWCKPLLIWAVWSDYQFSDFHKENINLKYVYRHDELLSACAHIITDNNNNQITAFYMWAMICSDKITLKDVDENIAYHIVSPCMPDTMIANLKQWKSKWIKSFFDPGQAMSVLSKEHLLEAIDYADYLMVNEYEFDMIQEKTQLSKEQLTKSFDKIIITLWKLWTHILSWNDKLHIDAIPTQNVIDPTWAWDSFRWWFLVWLVNWFNLEKSAKIWTLVAHYCIQQYWTQIHKFTMDEFRSKFKQIYWEELGF